MIHDDAILRVHLKLSVALAAPIALSLALSQSAGAQTSPPPPATQLPPVTVEAKKQAVPRKAAPKRRAPAARTVPAAAPPAPAPQPMPSAATGGAYGPVQDYVATRSATGTKTDTPLNEIPQSISVVGTEQIRDQGAQSVQEALRYMPGVVPDGFGLDSRGDYSFVRGIPAAYFLDGMRTAYGYYANTAGVDPFSLERIEVLRGPSSMLFGQSSSGGIINMVSKRPPAVTGGEIGVDYGSHNFKQVKMDVGGPVTADGKWLYRVVGLIRDSDTQVDFVSNDRMYIAPSLTFRPTQDTSITVLANWRKDHGGSTSQFLPHAGTLYPNVNGQLIPISRFIGEPTDYNDTKQQSVSLLVDHKFTPWLSLHHGTRYTHTDNTYSTHYTAPLTSTLISQLNAVLGPLYDPSAAPFLAGPLIDGNQQNIARVYLFRNTKTNVLTSDTNLTGTFFTGPVAHKLTAGVDYTKYETGGVSSPILVDNVVPGLQSPFNVYNPTYGRNATYLNFDTLGFASADNIPLQDRPDETQVQRGLYIQDQIKIGGLTAVLGLRKDWLTMDQTGRDQVEQTALSGRAGLMYNLGLGVTPYVSFSQSFAAQPGNLVIDNPAVPGTPRPADPLKGEQVEVGVKFQPAGLPIMINAAWFDLREENRLVDDVLSGFAQQGAAVRIRGFELEAIGKVTDNIKLIGAYTYMKAVYEKHFNSFEEGTPVEGVPQHMASLWGIYTVNGGLWRGLSFGGGVRYVGATEDSGMLVTGTLGDVKTPAFTLFDAMVAYERNGWRWQLVGTNLEDKYHVVTCTTRGDCGVGQGRTLITSLSYKF